MTGTDRTIHHNAVIYTLDPEAPWASVLVVENGRVAAVGGEDLLEPGTALVDHGGAFLMPGLADVHNHHLLAGRADLFELQLDGHADLSGLLATVKTWADDLGPDAWVVGGGWGSTLIPELSRPSALAALDAAVGGRPVLLRDDSCHNRWVSSAALALAGIDSDSPDPADGEIVRDPDTRAPVGLLIESALLPVERAFAAAMPSTVERDAAASARGIEILHSFGITAFQDAAASLPMLAGLRHLDVAGDLHAWVVTSLQVNDKIFGTHPLGRDLMNVRERYRTPHHRPDFVKIFLDGVPTSRTAAFLEPYLSDHGQDPDWCGTTTMTLEELAGWLLTVAEEGMSAKVHCTGDGSVRLMLDAVAQVRAAGHVAPRFHIAHGQYIAEDDLPRLAALDVVADLSPPLWFPGVIVEAICSCIPRERAERLHPNRDLIDSGALLAGGSDWPVMPSPNPWYGIQGLVERADPSGEFPGTLWPEQAITLAEALHIYTLGASQAMGIDDLAGSLEVGKSADFVVLDQNPFAPTTRLSETSATQTWFAGACVYERNSR